MSTYSSDLDFNISTGSDSGLTSHASSGDKTADAQELQQFLAIEQQKQEMRQQVQMLTDMCWDKCIEKPQSKLDTKTEACLGNCVSRFIDVSLLIRNRFAQHLQKMAGASAIDFDRLYKIELEEAKEL